MVINCLAAEKTKVSALPSGSVSKGFCCIDGQMIMTDRNGCLSRKGIFSLDKKNVLKICSKKGIRSKIVPKTAKVVAGYCCDKGKLTQTTPDICRKQKGVFYESKQDADKRCGETRGFCCKDGQLQSSRKIDCDRRKGIFFVDRAKGFKTCQQTNGFCCTGGEVLSVSKADCDKSAGSFFVTKKDANETCRKSVTVPKKGGAVNRYPQKTMPSKNLKPSRGSANSFLRMLPDLHVTRTKLNRNCYLTVQVKNSGGPVSEKDHDKATVHISAGQGNVLAKKKRYLKVIDPAGRLKKAGGVVTYTTDLRVSGKQSSLVWIDTGHHITESNEQNNGDFEKLSCPETISHKSEKNALKPVAGTQGALSATIKKTEKKKGKVKKIVPRKAPVASRLPIEIFSPRMNLVIEPGQEVTVRYRIIIPSEAGEVEFNLVNGHGEILSTMTQLYEPPHIPDLSDAELTPYGTGRLGEDLPAEGEPAGRGDLAFIWSMPEDLPPESTCYIRAFKGTLQGRSATMIVRSGEHLEPGMTGYSGLRLSIVGGGRIRRPGESVRCRIDLLGMELPPFTSPGYEPGSSRYALYFHPASESRSVYESEGGWSGWSVISQTEDRRSMTVEFRLPEAGSSYGEYDETDEFKLSFRYLGVSGHSAVFFVRPEGVGETGVSVLTPAASAIWPTGTDQSVSWRFFGFEDPESLVFSIKLLDGETVRDLVRTDRVTCNWLTGLCSTMVRVSGRGFEALTESEGGLSPFRAAFEVEVKRRGSIGVTLASGRSARFAVANPGIEVISPTEGDILTLYNPLTVTVRFLGGAIGPARVNLHEPSGSSDSYGLVECPGCPSVTPQDVVFTGPEVYDDYFSGVRGDITGVGGFYVSASSETEYLSSARSRSFSFRYPDIIVSSPVFPTIMRNGSVETFNWEFDAPFPLSHYTGMFVDIVLKNETTGDMQLIGEEVASESSHGGLVGGSLRWAVGYIIDNPGGLNHGRRGDLSPGRYSIKIRSHRRPSMESDWYTFTVIDSR